mmetsp:Transcript_136/g.171  ORF Transcript_136/g.171 Transcript_136/m.171 type:complete len:222 (-) Transcript_136:155-820(-)
MLVPLPALGAEHLGWGHSEETLPGPLWVQRVGLDRRHALQLRALEVRRAEQRLQCRRGHCALARWGDERHHRVHLLDFPAVHGLLAGCLRAGSNCVAGARCSSSRDERPSSAPSPPPPRPFTYKRHALSDIRMVQSCRLFLTRRHPLFGCVLCVMGSRTQQPCHIIVRNHVHYSQPGIATADDVSTDVFSAMPSSSTRLAIGIIQYIYVCGIYVHSHGKIQ